MVYQIYNSRQGGACEQWQQKSRSMGENVMHREQRRDREGDGE